jgi:branched-chain amino acid transport system ATP-binding protein
MSNPILSVSAITKRFGGFVALSDVSLNVHAGQRVGLIGPNGSGKTTLINCISGVLINDAGSITFNDTNISRLPPHRRARLGIARTFQIPQPFSNMTVLQNLCVPLEFVAHGRELSTAGAEDEALALLERFGLDRKAHTLARKLSQVELRKLELARAVAARPSLLISDESMAGLAPGEVDEVLASLMQINASGITVLMIEHIMRAIMRFSQHVVCLDAGQVIARGEPADLLNNRDVQRAYLGA